MLFVKNKLRKTSVQNTVVEAFSTRAKYVERRGLWAAWVATGILLGSSDATLAQTKLQQTQAEGVLESWKNIAGTMMERPLTPIEQALFNRLDELLQTGSGMSANGIDLDLTNDELNAAYQQVAAEETTTFRSTLTDSSYAQMNNILSRFTQLRAGAGGFTVAGMGFNPGIPGLAQPYADGNFDYVHGGGAGGDAPTDFGNLGAFLNMSFATGDVDGTAKENEYDYDTYGITAGIDYRFNSAFVLGGALGYSNLDSDYKRSAVVSGGNVDADGYSFSLYGTYYKENFYIDGIASYGKNEYKMKRSVVVPLGQTSAASQSDWIRTAKADTDSDQYQLAVGAGYNIWHGATSISPYLRVNYLKSQIDDYRETGAAELEFIVDDYDVDSLTSVLGVSATRSISRNFGVLIPHGRVAWVHEYQNDAEIINYRYAWEAVPTGGSPWVFPIESEKPDRDYYILGLGMSGAFRNGSQLFFDYQTLLGHKRVTEHLFTAGIRLEF